MLFWPSVSKNQKTKHEGNQTCTCQLTEWTYFAFQNKGKESLTRKKYMVIFQILQKLILKNPHISFFVISIRINFSRSWKSFELCKTPISKNDSLQDFTLGKSMTKLADYIQLLHPVSSLWRLLPSSTRNAFFASLRAHLVISRVLGCFSNVFPKHFQFPRWWRLWWQLALPACASHTTARIENCNHRFFYSESNKIVRKRTKKIRKTFGKIQKRLEKKRKIDPQANVRYRLRNYFIASKMYKA